MVPRDGFEPTTLGLEVLCSIQLSYRGVSGAGGESRTPVSNLEGWNNGRYTTPATGAIISSFIGLCGFLRVKSYISLRIVMCAPSEFKRLAKSS